MRISVRGAKNRKLTNTLKLAALTFGKYLLSTHMMKYVEIEIIIFDKLSAGGYIHSYDERRPRCFVIELYRFKRTIEIFKTLAHEMVHLKQLAKEEIKPRYYKNSHEIYWRGVKYNDVSYWDQPWEIEAYGLMNSLVAKFLNEYDLYDYLKQKRSDW